MDRERSHSNAGIKRPLFLINGQQKPTTIHAYQCMNMKRYPVLRRQKEREELCIRHFATEAIQTKLQGQRAYEA